MEQRKFCIPRYCSYGAILVHIITGIVAYHFDVDNVILYEDLAQNENGRGSYFGFSSALWNVSSEKSFIFIGAPRANSNATGYKGIKEPGTIFKCEIGKPCDEWITITVGHTGPQDGSWLGSSINIGKHSDKDILLICAPRWQDKNHPDAIDSYLAVMSGICYTASADSSSYDRDDQMAKVLEPLDKTRPRLDGTLYFAMGQAGFSTHILNPEYTEYMEYVLGCPGALDWHGIPILLDDYQERSFIIPTPLNDSTVMDNAYSGYAVTSGFYFITPGRTEDNLLFVTGAPRAANLSGEILVFYFPTQGDNENRIDVRRNKTGEQTGEYFGSVLATCDINGDGIDDLLVGAPQWSQTKGSDEGRIYIFRGNDDEYIEDFKDRKFINGKTLHGRFGSAITCLGDIDHDGYADVAVGAPYDGDGGAVYIYHGSEDGLIEKNPQKISAPQNVRGFGISISEPKDIDNNHYADIAVGAYLSGHVAVFRSKRVVHMTTTFSSSLSGQTLRQEAESFIVSICSSYDGAYAPQELNVTNELKIDEVHSRAEMMVAGKSPSNSYKYNETITISNTSCQNFTISITKKGNQNFLIPLNLMMTQRLNTNDKTGTLLVKKTGTIGIDGFDESSVVMNGGLQEIKIPLKVLFATNCGNNSICNSKLSISMTADLENIDRYVIGSVRYIKLDIAVTNNGEQAYLTKAIITIPNYIPLRFIPSACLRPEKSDEIICDISNLLDNSDTKNISLELDMSKIRSEIEEIPLTARATTQSNDAASGNHTTSIFIKCVPETDIGITGLADVDKNYYTLKGENEQLVSIGFRHTYEIKNYQVTPISKARLSVSVPTHWVHGSNEIEVVKVNKTTGVLDRREYSCMGPKRGINIGPSSYDELIMNEPSIGHNRSVRSVPQKEKEFNIVESKMFDASLDNRTLHINCTNPSFKCITINCEFKNFETAESVAKVVVEFDLLLQNLTPEIIQRNDIIYFVSNASTRITTQTVNNKPDSIQIGTMFVGSPPIYSLPTWLIPLSVSMGLLLLIFVILGLFKFGFFNRSKKAELDKLKEQDDTAPKVRLETTSSTEALDAAYYIK